MFGRLVAESPNQLKCFPNQCVELYFRQVQLYSTRSSSNHKPKNTHYDSLGVHPKSSQAQIKSAYYRLSKVYHPDKNKGENASVKFQEISTAYEVLGNENSRDDYDKSLAGGINHLHHRAPHHHPHYHHGPEAVRKTGRRIHVGRTRIYDYDEHIRQHYGHLRNREKMERHETQKRRQRVAKYGSRNADLAYLCILMLGLVGLFFIKKP